MNLLTETLINIKTSYVHKKSLQQKTQTIYVNVHTDTGTKYLQNIYKYISDKVKIEKHVKV